MSGFGEFSAGVHRFSQQMQERQAIKQEMGLFERSRVVTEWGFLGPGDPPPLPEAANNVMDYRGVVQPQELESLYMSNLEGRFFPVGAAMEVRAPANGWQSGPLFAIGVPFEILRRHAIVIGGAGTGKTRYVIVPWIYSALQHSSVVTMDCKGDMLELIREYSQRWGSTGAPVAKWDYKDPDHSFSWNWIADIDDEDSLDAALTALMGRKEEQGGADPFFYDRDRLLLGGLLQLAPELKLRTATDLLAFISRQGNVDDALDRFSNHPGGLKLQAALDDLDPMEFRKVIMGVVARLNRLATPDIDRVTSGKSRRLRLDDIVAGRRLLVVAAPSRGGYVAEALSGLFLNMFIQRLYRRFTGAEGHVFLFIDEAPRFVKQFDFPKAMALVRSAGVSIILAVQDVNMFEKENERSAIISNCATWLSLSGVEDPTIKYLQGRLGKHNLAFWTQGAFAHRVGVDLRTQVESRPVLGEREISSPPGTRGAVLHMKDPRIPPGPILVDLEPPWM